MDTTPELEGADGLPAAGRLRAAGRIMADDYRREAGPGVLVQLPDGSWVRKGEGP